MKDPLDKKERAYEILGVGQDASVNEINQAYARLTREHPERRAELANAWQRLRKAQTRLEEDFWHYMIPDAGEGDAPADNLSDKFPWDPALPPLEVGLEHTDLAGSRYRRDFTPVTFRDVRLSHLERYDTPPTVASRPSLEK